MMKDECCKPRNRKMTTCWALSENLKENQFYMCSGSIVQKIKKKKNSTSAHGKIRVAEEPILVWLHFISAASNDTMILDCQALMRGKKKSLLKSPQWRYCRIIFYPQSSVQIIFSTVNTIHNIVPNITVDGDCSHEIKTLAPWKES